MNTQRAAEVQAVLEGIRLPAARGDLIAYARRYDASVAVELERLPDDEFDRLDAVGELLLRAPSAPRPPESSLPRPESGSPPGGSAYLTPFPAETGHVREDAPPENPPQEAIEQATARQKKQQGG